MPQPLSRPEQLAEADRIISENPPELQKWLEDEKLTITDAVHRVHNGSWESALRARNLLNYATSWLSEQKKRLTNEPFRVTGHERVAREVAWRFSMVKMMQMKNPPRPKKKKQADTELDVLPAQLRWVYEHPALEHPPGMDLLDEAVEASIKDYESKNPSPGQGAVNYLNHCKRDKQARQKMFEEVRAFLLESRKKRKEKTQSEDDKAEEEACLDIAAEIEKFVKGGV